MKNSTNNPQNTFSSYEEDYDTDLKLFGKHIGFGTILTSAFMTLFGGIFTFVGIYQLVFILVAPKLYLIEYFVK